MAELDQKTEEAAGIIEIKDFAAGGLQIEGRGIQPVPFESRHHSSTWENFTVWFS